MKYVIQLPYTGFCCCIFWWFVQNERIWFIVFNSTFSNILAISWQPVLVVEEAGVPRENHRPWANNW